MTPLQTEDLQRCREAMLNLRELQEVKLAKARDRIAAGWWTADPEALLVCLKNAVYGNDWASVANYAFMLNEICTQRQLDTGAVLWLD